LRAGSGLQEAFLDGYGRQPNDDELFLLRVCYALAVVRYVILARAFGQADHEASLRAVLHGLMYREYG
jgi:hypothetical protein